MLTFVYCPECNVPAEITDRFALPSTGGPVGHFRLLCACRHCFTIATDLLPERIRHHLRIQAIEPHVAYAPTG